MKQKIIKRQQNFWKDDILQGPIIVKMNIVSFRNLRFMNSNN